MRLGSLFSGYGGLEQAVEQVLGTTTAWVSDIDPGACKLLTHRYPDTPNLGDVTAVDWSTVEPVDVLTGGFPCQDVSHAGKRAGLHAGTRTGLWSHMAAAIDLLRPTLVVAENVRGLLSASATSDVEPCPWCMGDDADVPLRALGAVLGDLADIGYDACWYGLRAADVGAPHGRFRIFVVAYPNGVRLEGAEPQRVGVGVGERVGDGVGGAVGDADVAGLEGRGTSRERGDERAAGPAGVAAPDADAVGHERGRATRGRGPGPANRGVAAADTGGQRHGGRENPGGVGRVDRGDAGEAWERERARPVAGDRGDAATPDTERRGRQGVGRSGVPAGRPSGDVARLGSQGVEWGAYAAAVHRWATTIGRPAPPPTEPGRTGTPRLSPTFVEWMMGLPAGWVTNVPGLSRNAQLKLLGNGVVPQQAAAALRVLLAESTAPADLEEVAV